MNKHRKDSGKPNLKDFSIYEDNAEDYDMLRFCGLSGNWGHKLQMRIIESLVEDWSGKKVLELGCGTGRITEELAALGADVTAADISAEMLKVAEMRFQSKKFFKPPKLMQISLFDIDIEMNDYDLVLMINVFGRLTDPGRAIKALAWKMPPKSRLVFTFPCLTSVFLPFGLLVNMKGKSLARDVTSHWYTPKTVETFCKKSGFEVVGWHGNHYVPLPRILYPSFPFIWVFEKILSKNFPKSCPSVFVDCRKL